MKSALSLFYLALLPWLPFAAADNATTCECYLTNGSSPAYFTSYKFYDFRSFNNSGLEVPPLMTDAGASQNASTTHPFFSSKKWTDDWGIQAWDNQAKVDSGDSSVYMVNSPNNVYLETYLDSQQTLSSMLTLRTARTDGFQSAAEFESTSSSYQYASIRMMARTIGSPGAISAMFTYRAAAGDDELTVQESDIEFRTEDPVEYVQYTNQPVWDGQKPVPDATKNASMPLGRDQFAVHRLDWTPNEVTWYVGGRETGKIAFQTPKDPSKILFNCWSDGSDWVGNMTEGTQATLQIQWIEMVFNSSSARGSGDCKTVCSIDEAAGPGTPAVVNSAPQRSLNQREASKSLSVGASLMAIAAVRFVL